MKKVILSNFHPIQVGKLIDQAKLNQYTKFLYYHFQNLPQIEKAESEEITNEAVSFDFISDHVDKYTVSRENINSRQCIIFEGVEDFIDTIFDVSSPSEYRFPKGFEVIGGHSFGPKIEMRMGWFKEKMGFVFDHFYTKNTTKPENLIHVTCSGYSSPSVAQEAVIERKWDTVQVTHSYHMGCYGAFPAIRTAYSLICASAYNGRADVVHTELLSVHLNLTEFSPPNTMICSLFADGFIGYSLYEEEAFFNDDKIIEKKGLRILAFHEVIIPDSLEDMSWDLGEYNFLMTLSKRVPVFIRKNIKAFLTTLCEKGNVSLENQKEEMHFAIHPGGPKIIDYVVGELGLENEQAHWSYEVLRIHGNMSSATIPHILDKIIEDPNIESGKKIVAMAFGPGLTATGLLLEKL
ncbi:3-oxoacyl-[acyl-carrier-protein] synthase III C-terminal domain-containing protein [Flavobacterium sp. NG2]|uniref:3-oxoacyl-[acyl-carrier-protein] synthase III C-terminal domain-containing protein n=1 Tax=Flavobacterium sp. NG2 TaxID=3097547 RepID=UPI002A801F4C|nr:3-oxoacyl-[acyl-carrier-protein] synthase III C-terminal domain-containing protein [Flavobacterium sp. NG2]WPR72921.1 3-oxoacyl-[acyl-carrier-protein] synthase III C-terminal domain-containing protein [Flavobacterium sp. NG2]